MPNIAALSNARDIDTYYVEINRGGLSNGDSQVSFTQEQNVGGSNIFASQNYQFNAVLPQFSVLTPSDKTTVSAQIRTVSGTSAGGDNLIASGSMAISPTITLTGSYNKDSALTTIGASGPLGSAGTISAVMTSTGSSTLTASFKF